MSRNNSAPTTDSSVSRRTVLRTGTAAVALGSIAGCSALPGGSGGGLLGGFNYGQYLIEPNELDRGTYSFSYSQPTTFAENEDNLDSDAYDSLEDGFSNINDLTDVDYDAVNHLVEFGPAIVMKASFNKEDVVETIEDNENNDFDDDEISGFTTYINEAETQGFAINGETIIYTSTGRSSDRTPDDVLELIIGAKNGEEDRYADEYEAFGVLTDKLGTSASVSGSASEEEYDTGEFDNVVASGSSTSINGENSTVKIVYVHEDEDDVDVEGIQDFIEDDENGFTLEEANDYTVSSSGRATIINAEYDTDEENLAYY
jgi:hypothetical protein